MSTQIPPPPFQPVPLGEEDPRSSKELALSIVKNIFISTLIFWGSVFVVVLFVVTRFETVGLWLGWIAIIVNILMTYPVWQLCYVSRYGVDNGWDWLALLIAIISGVIHLLFAYYIYLSINGLRLF